MWDQTLQRIKQDQTPLLAARRWSDDIDTVHLVNKGVNLVYYFEHKSQRFYLRITHQELRPKKQLLAAILYQHHLFQCQVAICEPVQSNRGEWIESIQQEDDYFLAHVCKEVPGQPIHFMYDDNHLYQTWGKTLGSLHKATQSYDTNNFEYAHWKKSIREMHQYAKNEEDSVQKTLDHVTKCLNARLENVDNFGLTHGDHRQGNVLTNGKTLHIIDFDLPAHNWFSEDVFRPFFDSILENDQNYKNKIFPYLEGYFEIMPENSLDLSTLAQQFQIKCLEIYLWTKNNWSDESDAPGGHDKIQWLDNIYQKIIRDDWIERLPIL